MATSKIPAPTKDRRVFIAAKNAYASYAAMFAAMETVFDSLSSIEKNNAYLVINNHGIARCSDTTSKLFSNISFNNQDNLVDTIYDLKNHIITTYTMNPNISKTQISSETQTTTFQLRTITAD